MEYEKLCRAVEQELHREVHTPADFDYLSEQLLKKTGCSVSSSTLMRLWGYRPSVTVRVSTLDILARFIGYKDYTHFHRVEMEGEIQEDVTTDMVETAEGEKEEKKEVRSHFRYGWTMAVIAVVVAVTAGILFYFYGSRTREDMQVGMNSTRPISSSGGDGTSVKSHFITRLSDIRNDRKYLIHTRRDSRGVLGLCGRHLASTYGIARFYRSEEPSPFALIRHEGSYYLYSVQECCFVNVLLYLTDEPLREDFGVKNWCAWDVREEHDCLVFDFRCRTKVYTLNVNAGEGMIMNTYGTDIGAFDDGNLFMLEDVGSFDATEPLRFM